MTQETNILSLSTVQEVLDYIECNITEEITPDKIASHFYISASTISALFKIVCGMTIMEYIRNRRLTLAAEELSSSNVRIIDLAYKYGYETPEAFTKAFTRLHGFPPSFVRRAFPITKVFKPLQITVNIQGGWEDFVMLTESNSMEQDRQPLYCYNNVTNNKVGKRVTNIESGYQINVSAMQYKKEWNILHSVAQDLLKSHIPFKVDGKTMIFAHGLEIPLDRICLTFKWNDEARVKAFFSAAMYSEKLVGDSSCGYGIAVKCINDGFKYFDVMYKEMQVRCMFYGDCPGADTDDFLYKNTDLVQINNLAVSVQSLEFYYENAETDTEYYKMVEARLNSSYAR